MMSYQDPPQRKLFYIGINLDKRIRKDHPLRKIRELIDFDFIYKEVKDKYGYNGNESIPPPVILKLMLLLVLYNVRSERELMDTLGERGHSRVFMRGLYGSAWRVGWWMAVRYLLIQV